MDLSALAVCPHLRRFLFGTRFYALTLGGKVPDHLRGTPPNPWPGDPAGAAPFLETPSVLPGITKTADDAPWRRLPDDDPKAAALHRFAWLADLHAAGAETARQRAQVLLSVWIDDHRTWQPLPWRPDITGERLTHWFVHHEFLTAGTDDTFRARFYGAAARQARHLRRIANAPPQDERQLLTLKGLIYSGVCLPGFEAALDEGLTRLERLIERQLLPDGGHVGRSPSVMLGFLRHLIDLRATLLAGQVEVPGALQGAIDRIAPMVRCLRAGDGGLALFNGGTEETNDAVNLTFVQANAKGKALTSAPHTGYQRLAARRTVVLVDVGEPAAAGFDHLAHAGPLSFELSVGKERLIVNCGTYIGADATWHAALRATAAHSTVAVNDTNAIEVAPNGGLISKGLHMMSQRRENEGNIWLEASHDGYRKRFGIVHKRRLYLAANGEDIRGDDELQGAISGTFAIRFHLHPGVRASLVQDGSAVLLRLKSGAGWRLRTNGGLLALDESIYLGDGRHAKRSQQAVITGTLGPDGALVKWRLDRVSN